ncbi:hypothetical protein DFJ43DRAFT_643793 [Lentinula guzmanii]|uniref:Uncharacterized protein n=1 Tax=Lentinula guzmanii TaxID=2804957 RepID=A0AA38MXF3_9AGAR|nr:hypothetical protein DFJ43DRAFT_643793 [Lentinula guzmanii]
MTFSSLVTLFFLLTTCCLAFARLIGLFFIQCTPLSITISPFRLSKGSRRLAVGETRISFHFPRRNRPQWATISIYNINYRSTSSQHFTIAEASLAVLFPFSILNNTTSRPAPMSLSLDDFRLRIPSSQNTPSWVVALRRNILYTILNEETQRLDQFRLKTIFSTLEMQRRDGSEGNNSEVVKDESRITHHSSQWHIYNRATSRLYQFGRLSAQLRRTWKDDSGTFTLIAEDCHWVRQSHNSEEDSLHFNYSLNYLYDQILTMISFIRRVPAMLHTLYIHPKAIYSISYFVDIHISRTDITFDCFHISDAEPLRHGAELLRRNLQNGLGPMVGIHFI